MVGEVRVDGVMAEIVRHQVPLRRPEFRHLLHRVYPYLVQSWGRAEAEMAADTAVAVEIVLVQADVKPKLLSQKRINIF